MGLLNAGSCGCIAEPPARRWWPVPSLAGEGFLVRVDHDFSLMIRQPVVPRTSGSIVSAAAQITHA